MPETTACDISTLPYPPQPPESVGWSIQLTLDSIENSGQPGLQAGYWHRYSSPNVCRRDVEPYTQGAVILLWTVGLRVDETDLRTRLRQYLPVTPSPEAWERFIELTPYHGFYLLSEQRYRPAVRLAPGREPVAIPGRCTEGGLVACLRSARSWVAENGGPVEVTPFVYHNPESEGVYLQECNQPEADETVTGLARYMPNNNTIKVSDTHSLLPSNTGTRVCGRCGEVGHNVRTCENHFQLWDKMGIEVEGRFLNLREKRVMAVALTGEEGTSDGSLRRSGTAAECWEFRTRPGKLASAMNQLHALYPDETGPDCGMHIHVSFSTADIALLYNTDFFTYFRAEWKSWGEANNLHRNGEFWKRLNGENNYCRQNITVAGNMLNMDRYHQLNFSAWEAHKTVECRLLPMFKSEALALSACKKLISIYETWLSMDHSTRLPDVDVDLPAYTAGAEEINSEVEVLEIKFSVDSEIPLVEIPPAAAGMMRVVIPTGRVQSPDVAGRYRAEGVADFVRDHTVSLAA